MRDTMVVLVGPGAQVLRSLRRQAYRHRPRQVRSQLKLVEVWMDNQRMGAWRNTKR